MLAPVLFFLFIFCCLPAPSQPSAALLLLHQLCLAVVLLSGCANVAMEKNADKDMFWHAALVSLGAVRLCLPVAKA